MWAKEGGGWGGGGGRCVTEAGGPRLAPHILSPAQAQIYLHHPSLHIIHWSTIIRAASIRSIVLIKYILWEFWTRIWFLDRFVRYLSKNKTLLDVGLFAQDSLGATSPCHEHHHNIILFYVYYSYNRGSFSLNFVWLTLVVRHLSEDKALLEGGLLAQDSLVLSALPLL